MGWGKWPRYQRARSFAGSGYNGAVGREGAVAASPGTVGREETLAASSIHGGKRPERLERTRPARSPSRYCAHRHSPPLTGSLAPATRRQAWDISGVRATRSGSTFRNWAREPGKPPRWMSERPWQCIAEGFVPSGREAWR